MRMGLKWSKCARPDHVGRALPVTRSSLGEGPARGDAEVTQEGTAKRGEELCYECTIARCHNPPSRSPSLSFPLIFLSFPPAKRFTVRTALTLSFSRDFLFFFSTSFPALLSSIYVPVSPTACAPSTPLAPTASPLMVSASAVSISAFYLLSAVSALFFTSLLFSLVFLLRLRPFRFRSSSCRGRSNEYSREGRSVFGSIITAA